MPHADSSFVPEEIKTKQDFYEHVEMGIVALTEGQTYWVSNLANASALLYHSYLGSPQLYGMREDGEPVVNWTGFYIHPPELASSRESPVTAPLLLGPFNGRPACQQIIPRAGKGVCADAFVNGETVLVADVHEYPGHIACDGMTNSEIVVPLLNKVGQVVGVLDLDSTVKGTFTEEDRIGLERIARHLAI
ncbi:hypothetical protein QFC22_005063 [Naganishia vaughanmartiniae]|uniref:Uncharacterized protein n=1 Tax=Naganishia vaughanmartiniae TaxID=1424756 RepID=A0ACC2WXP4_9TREE|nr:hypothetical protein QFC22_005063 [Naganishia vaughanmartiniae]